MMLFSVICDLGIIQPTKKQKIGTAINGVKTIKIKPNCDNDSSINSALSIPCNLPSSYYNLKTIFSNKKNWEIDHLLYFSCNKQRIFQPKYMFRALFLNPPVCFDRLIHRFF